MSTQPTGKFLVLCRLRIHSWRYLGSKHRECKRCDRAEFLYERRVGPVWLPFQNADLLTPVFGARRTGHQARQEPRPTGHQEGRKG